MSPEEAKEIVRLLIQMWPAPELEVTGLQMLMIAVMDTGLSVDEAKQGIRALLQEHHAFRPSPAQLKAAARPVKVPYHRPYLVRSLEAPVAPEPVVRSALEDARRALRGGVE